MIHVLLRIAVWVIVLGIGYLVLGPQLFDSTRGTDPFANEKELFLPPVKTQRQTEIEEILKERSLSGDEVTEYHALVKERQSNFWLTDGVSVEDALIGVKKQRKERLIEKLVERGMSSEELAVFLTVVERDHAALLRDLE